MSLCYCAVIFMFVLFDCFSEERTDWEKCGIWSGTGWVPQKMSNAQIIFLLWVRGEVHFQTKNIISYNDSLFCSDHLKFQSVLLNVQIFFFIFFPCVNLCLKQGPLWWNKGDLYKAVIKHNKHNWECRDLVQIMFFLALRYIQVAGHA